MEIQSDRISIDELIRAKNRLIMEYNNIQGRKEMAWSLAKWRGGEQFVGVMETPYKEFISNMEGRQENIVKILGMTGCEIRMCYGCVECKK